MVRAPGQTSPRATSSRGFSLVELIVVIVITGIIASVVGLFITGPIQGFIDQSRRAELVDAAQLALTRMGRDLRGALPNSVRISGNSIEFLLTLDGDRYRVESGGTVDDDRLGFTAADTSFNTLSQLGAGQALPADLRLAIYPLGQADANPYADAVMTPSTTTVTVGTTTSSVSGTTEYRVGLNPGHRFPFDSPTRRVFLVSGPVSYLCDAGELLRYDRYAVQSGQPATRAAFAALIPAPATTIVVKSVQACSFQYSLGTSTRNAVVSIALSLADPKALEERVRLVRQIHVANAP